MGRRAGRTALRGAEDRRDDQDGALPGAGGNSNRSAHRIFADGFHGRRGQRFRYAVLRVCPSDAALVVVIARTISLARSSA